MQANELLRHFLQGFASDELGPAARLLFGDSKGSSPSLDIRRSAASAQMGMTSDRFIRDIEPSILNTLAYQIVQVSWPHKAAERQRPRLNIVQRLSYGIVLALLALSAASSWRPQSMAASSEAKLRVAAVTGAILLAIATLITSVKRRSKIAARSRRNYQISPYPDPDFLAACQSEAAQRLNQSRIAVPLLVEMILSPSEYRMRTVEVISLDGRSIKQHVSLIFSFTDTRPFLFNSTDTVEESVGGNGHRAEHTLDQPESGRQIPQLLYVPVLVPRKGDLIDQLEITRSDGRAAVSLSYEQSLRVISLGLRYLLVAALTEPGHEHPDFDNANFRKAELILLRLIARRGPVDRQGDEWKGVKRIVDDTLRFLGELFPLHESDGSAGATQGEQANKQRRTEALGHLRDYVLKLVQGYPIIVSLPNDQQPRRRLQFERTIVPAPRKTARLRLWLGLRPDRVEIPINLGFETESYHLEVVGPSEHYVHEQFIGCGKCNYRLGSNWRGVQIVGSSCHHAPIGVDDRCYIRVRRRQGQCYAHVYMRGFATSRLDDSEMVMKARFAEAPPGVEERALLSAVAASIVFGVTGYILSRYHKFPLPSDVPALFLAVPGVAATWFGFSSDADTVLRSSLTARISLLTTGLLSVAGVSCYLLQDFLGWKAGPRWGLFGIHEWIWLGILILSLANCGVIFYTSAVRMAHFVWLSSRAQPQSDGRLGEAAETREESTNELAVPQRS
jgi:hypothetical protein